MAATTIRCVRRAGRLWRGLRPWLLAGVVGAAGLALAPPLAAQSPPPAPPRGGAPQPVRAPGPAIAEPADLQALPVERTAPGAVRIEPVEEDYRIGSQDLLEVQVFGIQDLKREVRVNGKGLIGLPLIGTVHVAGLTTSEAEAMIGGLYRKNYLQNPEVSVFVKEFTRQRFTIEGAVAKPGMYPLKGPTTLLQGLALAGGQGSLGDLGDVTLFRTEDGERKATKLDVNKMRAAEAPDPLLQPDDLIVIGRSPGRVAIRDSLLGDIIGIFNPFNYIYSRP
jgi:polysaccharide export outer membrane protein